MSDKRPTVDFGAPDKFGAHVFRVEIPAARNEPSSSSRTTATAAWRPASRATRSGSFSTRPVWSAIADIARREFNDRLKAAKVPTGRWHTGTNLVERLLGKELCVLAWAAETANDEQLPVICSKWAALRPEERWWLFAMTVAEAGLPDDTQRGWRRASSSRSPMARSPAAVEAPPPGGANLFNLPLFKDAE